MSNVLDLVSTPKYKQNKNKKRGMDHQFLYLYYIQRYCKGKYLHESETTVKVLKKNLPYSPDKYGTGAFSVLKVSAIYDIANTMKNCIYNSGFCPRTSISRIITRKTGHCAPPLPSVRGFNGPSQPMAINESFHHAIDGGRIPDGKNIREPTKLFRKESQIDCQNARINK
jgi:hypothetical protein